MEADAVGSGEGAQIPGLHILAGTMFAHDLGQKKSLLFWAQGKT